MLQTVVASWPLFLGLGLLMLGNGLQGTLLGIRADLEGFPTAVTGLVMSIFYAGFLLGAVRAPMLIARVGHVRVFAAFGALASATVLVHAVFVQPLVWAVMRLLSGYAFAAIFIVAESWLNSLARNEDRAKVLSVYMFVVYLGMGGGQLLLGAADPGGFVLFTLVSVLISVAVVPMLLANGPAPAIPSGRAVAVAKLYRSSPLGIVGAGVAGLGGGAIHGMGAVYASQIGLDVAAIGVFMFGLMIAAMTGQFPVGFLADRFDRRLVIVVASGLAGTAAGLAGLAEGIVALGLLGITVLLAFPLYSVSVAHTNDHLDADGMVAAAGGMMMVNGTGAAIGPFAAGLVMTGIGPTGFPIFIGAAYAGLALFGVYRTFRRGPVPLAEQGPTFPIARATPVATAIAQDAAIEMLEAEAARTEPPTAATAPVA